MKDTIKNIIIHLRFPFSILLLPVFLFAYHQSPDTSTTDVVLLFIILHILVYPSSNGYNSYMDDDKGSIGGIKNPTKVSKAMFPVTIVMDIIALLLTIINFGFLVLFLLSLYILASRAYSYRGIRLKQYPIVGYFTVAIFQGPVIYALVRLALNKDIVWNQETVISSIISFLLIGAGYPISQIYQHKQDKEDGVYTLSMLLGIRGTFIFSGILFFIQASLLTYYFSLIKGDVQSLIIFFICLLPVLFQFNIWMLKSFKDESYANYENTMKTNILGAVAMNIFFIYLTLRTIL